MNNPDNLESDLFAMKLNYNTSSFSYEYHLKDHLGNTRATYIAGANGTSTITQTTAYYPFGLSINALSSNLENNPYLYNGKELHNELNMDLLDYGFRFYDPQTARWSSVDPLAEKYHAWSPYNYVRGNPIIRIDPNGLTDYTINKETGEIKQIGDTNNDPDIVLKTYSRKSKRGQVKYKKNGKAKVAFGGVAKGILSEERNFQENDEIINVGGDGQPSVDDVKSFTLQLSEYIGKEIKGFSYSSNGSGNVTDMLLGKYISNTYTNSFGNPGALGKRYRDANYLDNITQQFHTHPDGNTGATESAPEESTDVERLQSDKPKMPNASFIILYRVRGKVKPEKYDYTHEYRPKKR